MSEEQAIIEAVNGARMAGFLPHLAQMVDKLEKLVENRVKVNLDKGTLTPEIALNAWIEKLAYRRILTRTQQQVQFAEDSGAISVDTRHVPAYIPIETNPEE